LGNFITGLLERNEDGATYEGVVYDRFLTLRHGNGQVLSIFDMGEPISTNLPTNEIYEMVLVAAVPGDIQFFPARPPTSTGDCHGIVIETAWNATKGSYRRDRVELYGREWMLLATPLGHLLMNPTEIGVLISVGGFVQWKDPRLDLYAVV
jgi:hypothetical protein